MGYFEDLIAKNPSLANTTNTNSAFDYGFSSDTGTPPSSFLQSSAKIGLAGTSLFDGRTDGTLYPGANGTTNVSGTIYDSRAQLNDYVKANDYKGALSAGYKGTESDFALANTEANKGLSGMEMGQLAVGGGQLALGLAGYLDDKKTADAQRGLLKEQLTNAKKERETREGVRSGLAAAFGG